MDNRRRMLISGGISADPVLENNDWETISAISKAGKAAEFWKVGDLKNISIGGVTYAAQIIGFDHDDVTDSASYGRAKAGITFQLQNCYGTSYPMNSSATNSGGWKSSAMRTSTLATLKSSLSSDLQAVIQAVNKVTGTGGGSTSGTETVSDSLFLPSEIEVFGTTNKSVSGEGSQYAYYAAGNSKIKTRNGTIVRWWNRSPYSGSSSAFCNVSTTDTVDSTSAQYSSGVPFAFCV